MWFKSCTVIVIARPSMTDVKLRATWFNNALVVSTYRTFEYSFKKRTQFQNEWYDIELDAQTEVEFVSLIIKFLTISINYKYWEN